MRNQTSPNGFSDGPAFLGDKQEPIAIIGAACRLPGGVTSMGDLWSMISNSRSARGEFPADRLDANALFHPDPARQGSLHMKHGFFLEEDVSLFDAPFFSITAKEASGMDPMKRLLLEVSYECFENAGVPIIDLKGSPTGVFVGCMTNDYETLSTRDTQDLPYNAATGVSEALTANRVSWFFDLGGPSLTVDTACSSSLTALHLACQSLQLGETKMGLVAGVNLILCQNYFKQMAAIHTLSPEGICHAFDKRANGYGRGEGIGAVLVKRLKDALNDGDTIRAVIRGTGINNDGRTVGITKPSSKAQADLIKKVYDSAGLSYADTAYLEAHGTGTPIGDPIELEAIGMTFAEQRAVHDPLCIGSIKGNFGHTEGCSGLAGLFKAILCLENGRLVPTAGFQHLNPKIKLSEWKLTIPTENVPWPTRGQRRVSINSFGFGGSNAHAILDDSYHYLKARGLVGNHSTSISGEKLSESGTCVVHDDRKSLGAKKLFIFSAKDQSSLNGQIAAYVAFLEKQFPTFHSIESRSLNDLAYTLCNRRSHFDFRSFSVASSVPELLETLPKSSIKKRSIRQKNIILCFTGQGAQWAGMGNRLENRAYQESLNESARYLDQLGCPWSLIHELQRTESDSKIDESEYSQPLCTAVQMALTDMLRSWGVRPAAVVGHSSGEIGAAYAAGFICHKAAIQLAYYRGLCSSRVAHLMAPKVGAMLAAGLTKEEAIRYLQDVAPGSAVIGCVNSPSSVTISGDENSIMLLEAMISQDGKFARRLRIRTAYHSHHMRTVAQDYFDSMRDCPPPIQTGEGCLMFSSVTGNLISPEELDGEYWTRNLCEPVQFSDALSNLLAYTESRGTGRRSHLNWSAVIEIGPHGALKGPVLEHLAESLVAQETPYMHILERGKDATATSLAVAGQLWGLGHELDLLKVNSQERQRKTLKTLNNLPRYSWNHKKRFWHETESSRSIRLASTPRTDILGMPVENQNPLEPRWRNFLHVSEQPWIQDHKITGTILYPAAGMLVMAIEAAQQIAGPKPNLKGFHFERVSFERGLVIPSVDKAVETSLTIRHHDTLPHHYTFAVYSTNGGSWIRHSSGTVILEYEKGNIGSEENHEAEVDWAILCAEYDEVRQNAASEVETNFLYSEWAKLGLDYGETFRNVITANANPTQQSAHALVMIPDTKSGMPYEFEYPHIIHPATLDGIFHLVFIAFGHGKPMEKAAVPFFLEDMFVSADLPSEAGQKFLGYAKAREQNGREILGDLVASDESWAEAKICIRNFTFRQISSDDESTSRSSDIPEPRTTLIRWKEDVGFLSNARSILENVTVPPVKGAFPLFLPLSTWLDGLHHKNPDSTGLLICSDKFFEYPESTNLLTANYGSMLRKCLMIRTTAYFQPKGLEVDLEFIFRNPADESKMDLETNGYDFLLVVAMGDFEATQMKTISEARYALRPGGHLLVLHTDHQLTSLDELGFMPPMVLGGPDKTQFTITVLEDVSASRAPLGRVYLLTKTRPSGSVSALQKNISSILSAEGYEVLDILPSQIDRLSGVQQVLCLLEVEETFVCSWTSEEFEQFQCLIRGASHILWLTHGGIMQNVQSADFGPTTGLLRVIRTENPHIRLRHLDLSVETDISSLVVAKIISAVWRDQGKETEYAEMDSTLYIPRVVTYENLDYELERVKGHARPTKVPLSSQRPLKPRDLSAGDLVWCDDDEVQIPLAPGEVEIRVEYASLNSPDVSHGSQSTTEVVGIISNCAADVIELSAGMRVVVFKPNSFRTYVRQHKSLVQVVPSNWSLMDVVALPKAFIAAQYALLHLARLEANSSILYHGAESAVGQAVIQIAQHLGVKIWATVDSREKRDMLIQNLGLDSSCILDSNHQTVASKILHATQSQGVDVILFSDWSTEVRSSIPCLHDHGYIIDLSKEGNNQSSGLSRLDIDPNRNAIVARINVESLLVSKPRLVESLFRETMEKARNKVIRPIVPTIQIPVSEAKAASMTLQSRQNYGKVVMDFTNNPSVLTLPKSSTLQLDPHGTYILAGGLGSLGIPTAETMIRHGARHIIFLSRSGGKGHNVDLDHFGALEVKIEILKCDISVLADVQSIAGYLKNCNVRGLIHCAMLLEDSVFDNMSFDKWTRGTSPKIQGTINLHQCLPDNLDFFIMMSSVVSIMGNGGQANYAAGNAFQDDFAHYRRAQGLMATSINIGLVVSDQAIKTNVEKFGSLAQIQTTQEELQMVLEIAMRGSTANNDTIATQFALGVGNKLQRGDDMATVWSEDPKFNHRVSKSKDIGAAETSSNIKDALTAASSVNEAVRLVEGFLEDLVTLVTGGSPGNNDLAKPFYEFGVDSLKAVEVRNLIARDVKTTVSIFDILSPTPLSKLSYMIVAQSELVRPDVAKQATDEFQNM